MTIFLAQLKALISAVAIKSPSLIRWFDATVPVLPGMSRQRVTNELLHEAFVNTLQNLLYENFYCPGAASPQRIFPALRSGQRDGLTETIAELLADRVCWETGWTVAAIAKNQSAPRHLAVSRDGITLYVDETGVRGKGAAIAPGSQVLLQLPRLRPKVSPGFVFLLGETDIDRSQPVLLRVYWHLQAKGAAAWVKQVMSQLDPLHIGYHAKVADHATAYRRCDAGVIYLSAADYANAAPALRAVYQATHHHLRAAVPAMTLKLAPGVGAAIDPGTRESFGQARCGLLASALLDAYMQGCRGLNARLEHVLDYAAQQGVDFTRPFLPAAMQFAELQAWSSDD